MERFLNEMLKRSAVFDIVFWEGELKEVPLVSYLTLSYVFQTLAISH
jgi:hypothetical protein